MSHVVVDGFVCFVVCITELRLVKPSKWTGLRNNKSVPSILTVDIKFSRKVVMPLLSVTLKIESFVSLPSSLPTEYQVTPS